MEHVFTPSEVCSTEIRFELDNGLVRNVRFKGGCNGNLKAIGKLVEGMDAQELADKLTGNTCCWRSTSCADQLAIAVSRALEEERRSA